MNTMKEFLEFLETPEGKEKMHKSAKKVAEDFEYHSGNNDRWLTVEEMKKLINEI